MASLFVIQSFDKKLFFCNFARSYGDSLNYFYTPGLRFEPCFLLMLWVPSCSRVPPNGCYYCYDCKPRLSSWMMLLLSVMGCCIAFHWWASPLDWTALCLFRLLRWFGVPAIPSASSWIWGSGPPLIPAAFLVGKFLGSPPRFMPWFLA